MKKINKRFICILAIIMVILTTLPSSVLAEVKPWQPYAEYIPDNTPVVKRHLRGVWVSTVLNLDWPSQEARKLQNDAERIQKSKDEMSAILDKAVEMNMNAVFLQVSPEGDALYKSKVVPWSRYLSGTFGKDPGFDPLAFAIEEAHKRNLEIHAWFNPFRVSMDTKDATTASLNIARSVYKEHRGWIKSSMSRFVVDPGIPEAREWVINRVMEVVKGYDIDGVHFDDYFYYESREGELKDDYTFRKYNKGRFSNKGDWRRNNTYLLVKELSRRIRSEKSWVKFGVSPAGVWGNKSDGHTSGSNTESSFTNYDESFADTKKWVEEELVDYIAPQIYFSFANPRASYGEVASWWSNVCKGRNVHLYIGQAFYKINDDSDQYFKDINAVPEFTRQIRFNTTMPEIAGTIMFRAKNFCDPAKLGVVSAIKDDLWSSRALVPVMSWKGGQAPSAPVKGILSLLPEGSKLSWMDSSNSTAYYVIYRFDKGEDVDITSDASSAKIIGTLRKDDRDVQEFTDVMTGSPGDVFYVVTALDRLHHESSGLIISVGPSAYYTDLHNYTWAVMAVDKLHEKGAIKGDNYGRFNPGQSIIKGDFVHMTIKALDLKTDFMENFINLRSRITREGAMVIAANAIEASGLRLDEAGEEYLEKYEDAKLVSIDARKPLAILAKAGLINAPGNRLNPKRMMTRVDAAVMLYGVLDHFGLAQ